MINWVSSNFSANHHSEVYKINKIYKLNGKRFYRIEILSLFITLPFFNFTILILEYSYISTVIFIIRNIFGFVLAV